MKGLTRTGRAIFGVSMAALGIICFVYSDPVSGLEPLPAWTPGRVAFAYLTGLLLIVAGACIATGKRARSGATILGIMLLLWVLLLQLPSLIAHPSDGGIWTTTFETLALCGIAWVLAGSNLLPAGAGRICFAVSLLVFGALHLIYARFVATLVPAWIPGGLFWSYLTAAAFIAAGLSLATHFMARLAATLLGVMFGLWVLLLHAPRVAAKLHDRNEWTSLFIALAMCGGAWLLAGRSTGENLTK